MHCSSHNRTPGIRKLCLSHAHVLSVATVMLLYPVCPSHARSGVNTKFILYFYPIFPTCTANDQDMVIIKNNQPKQDSVPGSEDFSLLVMIQLQLMSLKSMRAKRRKMEGGCRTPLLKHVVTAGPKWIAFWRMKDKSRSFTFYLSLSPLPLFPPLV